MLTQSSLSRSSSPIILVLICIVHNLPLIYSQTAANCVAVPCVYIGECRDQFNECGEGMSYCNSQSLWLPACGGGGTLERPTSSPESESNENTSSANTNQNTSPTLQPTRMTPSPSILSIDRPQPDPTLPPQLISILSTPTPVAAATINASTSPTTEFEGWLASKDNPQNEEGESTGSGNNNNGVSNPSNGTGWFDVAGWDSGRGKEDEVSPYNFWGNNNKNDAVQVVMRRAPFFLLCITPILPLLL